MKRILLFIATNIAVLVVMSVILSLLGVDRFLTRSGLNLPMLLVFSLVVGFTGSIISLLMSKTMAKWSTGARVIQTPMNGTEAWLLQTVGKLAQRAGIGMPEVAVYDGEPNAFATGAFRDSALVAVSTGLLQGMTQDEVEAVLGHEVAHIANGDMVTMTLIQGVVNTFVVFLSRVVGFFVDSALRRNSDDSGPGIGYTVTVLVCQIVFGIGASLIVAWFSRHREFRADAGAARLLGTPQPMINALARLGGFSPEGLPQNLAALGISDKPGVMELFSTHPPLEQRIAALRGQR
ncbi:protease HtpX [Herbaspirillum seropedicae]|uniref:Protease HtpX homolog n=1 Tax=Herbaspirillum seropedicae (strain SmR1) TaxID=757424 RepID=D8J1X8_HERSS|nr:protease HtpX [Herbaspirillum seropedicae]ADJ64761.1 heat shock (with chaperone function) protein [Herbaspirillum seropedicae SmR1]AKN66668.1 heat shock protein HtpX [Herbaspirillum seropedicae]MDR6397385.1 heat shock protein HtpX [Herbaspirillum seropedicae]NQE28343.1 heat shock protein HtpX [Herbaspirillum seropedicae]UMU22658.1 protease HtpX [Herbaspirillum seropedicae]